MWHYSTFVTSQVLIRPSNDGRRHGRGTYLFDNFLTTFWQLFDNLLTTFDNFLTTFLTTFWQFIFLLFDTMWHYNTFVTSQVLIRPSNDGRRNGRGTYLFVIDLQPCSDSSLRLITSHHIPVFCMFASREMAKPWAPCTPCTSSWRPRARTRPGKGFRGKRCRLPATSIGARRSTATVAPPQSTSVVPKFWT
jgi:hypothetical protein